MEILKEALVLKDTDYFTKGERAICLGILGIDDYLVLVTSENKVVKVRYDESIYEFGY